MLTERGGIFYCVLKLASNILCSVCFLNKKTIVKVVGGGGWPPPLEGGWRGMVKDHTFALFNFWTLP